jgi:hypothetical protein
MISVREKDVKNFLCAVAETARMSILPRNGQSESSENIDLVVEDILAHDKLVLQAMFRHDTDFLEKHIADDALFTASDGKKYTKRMVLASVLEGPVVRHQVKARHSDVNSTQIDGIISVTATTTVSVYVNGRWKDAYESRGTGRYRNVDGEWISVGGETLYQRKAK